MLHLSPLWIARFAEHLRKLQPGIDRELACRLAYAAYPCDGAAVDPCDAAACLPLLDVSEARDHPTCAIMKRQICAAICTRLAFRGAPCARVAATTTD